MKQVKITKRCDYTPNGTDKKVPAIVGQIVTVSAKNAEKMVAGNVAVFVQDEKPGPKKAPTNRQKKPAKTR